MAVLNEKELHELAVLCGIDAGASIENKASLLVALDVLPAQNNMSDQDYAALVNQTLNKTLDNQFNKALAPVTVLRQNRQKSVEFVVPVGKENETLSWNVTEENGAKHDGQIRIGDTQPVMKDGQPARREINGVLYEKRTFEMPAEMDIGYHTLTVNVPGEKPASAMMIYAPTKCYDPIDIKNGGKTWGVPVQLYEQRSPENQGVGDLSDLAEIADTLGKNGAGIIGVNPLHAMFHNMPEEASPYSPASRTYFNHLYIDVTAVPDFKDSKKVQAIYDDPAYTAKRRAAQAANNVDYTTAFELKTPVLEACYDQFVKNGSKERKAVFEQFAKEGGERLKNFAVFQALTDAFSNLDPSMPDWRDWPAEYQDPNTPEVKAFAAENKDKVGFYTYLQWETQRQMEGVQEVCHNNGMKVGLYTDIAVGSAPYGYEAWGCKDLYMKASAGAPADVLSPNGQNWDVLGFKPQALKETGYAPFVEMLRNNMKTAGCTRLDHVLQLCRLYMIPEGKTAKEGAFVYYPVDDLMAIAALESNRNKCMLIGEDLGQLPDGFQDKLMDHGILSYRVLPFERSWGYQHGDDADNAFKHPEQYPLYSTAAPSTHDTPSLFSQWTARDVHLKDHIGYYTDSHQRDMEFKQYETERCALNWALNEKGCWDRVGAKPCSDPAHDTRCVPEGFEKAVADYLGQSQSAMLLFPFSDMFRTSYMGNIPGTRQCHTSASENAVKVFEPGGASAVPYPNWRPKMNLQVSEIKEMDMFTDIAQILKGYRKAGNDNAYQEGKVKVGDFVRPGRTEDKSTDAAYLKNLAEKLSQEGAAKTFAYEKIAEMCSPQRAQEAKAKTEEFKKDYEERRKRIEEVKAQYKDGWKPDFAQKSTHQTHQTPTPAAAVRARKAVQR